MTDHSDSPAATDDGLRRSALLKFEATMLFTQLRARIGSDRWPFFSEARRQDFSLQLTQSISPYRASFHLRLVHCSVLYDAYIEREAHVGRIGDDLWTLSFPGIEGKTQAALLRDHLSPLRADGFDIPNGEEYLDRQMNFSLGLYAACLMRVDVRFPVNEPALPAICRVFDLLAQFDDTPQGCSFARLEQAAQSSDDDAPDILFGDWQTWK